MRRRMMFTTGFGILFLFLIQAGGMLVEAIYILNLMNTSLDIRVAGLFFFFTPVFLLAFRRRIPRWFVWLMLILLALGRAAAPYLDTSERMIAAGIATGAAMFLLPVFISHSRWMTEKAELLMPAQGLALAASLSILLRTVNHSIDLSLTSRDGWVGILLAAFLLFIFLPVSLERKAGAPRSNKGITSAGVGCIAVITLIYFAFASPAVISRWTEGNYQLIVTAVSLFTLLWLFLSFTRPDLQVRIRPAWLAAWNLLFTLALTAAILAHTVQFPEAPTSPVVVVASPSWLQQVPLVLLLLLFPVLFIDFAVFSGFIAEIAPAPRRLAPGFSLGALVLVLSVFMQIFTNVWGYVEPVSTPFRNQFWLPHFLLAAGITLIILLRRGSLKVPKASPLNGMPVIWSSVVLVVILLATITVPLLTIQPAAQPAGINSLKVMTYNIQQGNDGTGEKSYEEQLDLIRRVDPDILGLQESDSARVSLNNNDIVRYFASRLGYHAYYGPKTVAGTYGTALLSKYPVENAATFFSYSDQDEIGTAQAEIIVGDERVAVFNVHPAGSEVAKTAFAEALLQRADSYPWVISLGDYNLRDYEKPYQIIDESYKNAWTDVYPGEIGADGTDMSGENRIDHIFVSPEMQVSDPVYVLPPDSYTDHPVHWATISW